VTTTYEPTWFDAGINVSVDHGTLIAGANTLLLSEEITHPGSQPLVGGTLEWQFTWEAPAYGAEVTLSAVGNAADGGGTTAGDGYAFSEPLVLTVDPACVDIDGDGFDICVGDCDDQAAAVFPHAPETCDGLDNDCDLLVDEDVGELPLWYPDADQDGFGVEPGVAACAAPAGHVATAGDCDDGDSRVHPTAPEEDCSDPVDYNCDGSNGYADQDGDGFAACVECDDGDSTRFPGAPEICDEQDDDCDGSVDEDACVAPPAPPRFSGWTRGTPVLGSGRCGGDSDPGVATLGGAGVFLLTRWRRRR
jgi:Putative metal-binding motif